MIPIIKPVVRDNPPFHRMMRGARQSSALFTTIAGHTNENDLIALQYGNMLLSVEDLNVLTEAREEADQKAQAAAFAVLPPADADQISFYFIEKKPLPVEIIPQPVGSLLNQET